MEHLDYLPFLQFIRDDKETVAIMEEALTIIPKVCDYLDGNLEAFNPTTTDTDTPQTSPTTSSSTAPTQSLMEEPSPSPSSSSSNLPKCSKRKRSSSTALNNDESDPSLAAPSPKQFKPETETTNGSSSNSNTNPCTLPPKKSMARTHSSQDFANTTTMDLNLTAINPTLESASSAAAITTETETTETETAPTEDVAATPPADQIRQKLQEDYDKFVRQIGELAALEREKNKLLGKFLSISSTTPSSSPSTSTATTPQD